MHYVFTMHYVAGMSSAQCCNKHTPHNHTSSKKYMLFQITGQPAHSYHVCVRACCWRVVAS